MKNKFKIFYYTVIGLCGCYALFVFVYGIIAWVKDIPFPYVLVIIILPVFGLIELAEHQIKKMI